MGNLVSDSAWVKDVPLTGFSNKALIIVSRFARVLKAGSGRVVTLQDPKLATRLFEEASASDDPKLRAVFDELVAELQQFSKDGKQAQYRGAKQVDVIDDDEKTTAAKKGSEMYRGVEVTHEQEEPPAPAEKSPGKKTFYRGVAVDD